MTIEKRPAIAANSALNLKSLTASKGAKASTPASDMSPAVSAFSALFSGLGVSEADDGEADATGTVTIDAPVGLNVAIAAGAGTFFLPQAQMSDTQVAATVVIRLGEQAGAVATGSPSGALDGEGNPLSNQPVRRTFSGPAEVTTVAYIGHGADGDSKVDVSSLSTQASRDKLQAETVVSAAEIRRMVDLRLIASHPGQKAMTEPITATDSFRPTSVRAGVESGLMGGGILSELCLEKVIFKSNVLNTDAAAMTFGNADLRSHASFADAVFSEGALGAAPADRSSGTFWVSGDVKSAEMTLHGIGEGSVEVSISLHGKQTHVSFRVDEDQTRAALADNGPALKDMLLQEGLELSAVSIGPTGSHLGSGSGNGQDHRSQREYRSFRMDSAGQIVDTGEQEVITGRKSSGLDVFV